MELHFFFGKLPELGESSLWANRGRFDELVHGSIGPWLFRSAYGSWCSQQVNIWTPWCWVNYNISLTWIVRPYIRGWFPESIHHHLWVSADHSEVAIDIHHFPITGVPRRKFHGELSSSSSSDPGVKPLSTRWRFGMWQSSYGNLKSQKPLTKTYTLW